MVNKKSYIQPDTTVILIQGSCIMITASGGEGRVKLTYDDEEDDASVGMSRRFDYGLDFCSESDSDIDPYFDE